MTPRSQRRDLGHPLMFFGFMEAVLTQSPQAPGNAVTALTAYLLQQFQLLALRGRRCLPPWGPACDRSAEPAFQLDYEVRCAQWPPDTLRLSQRAERLIIIL